MAKIRNVSGEDRIVPALGHRLVLAGQVVEVPDPESYVCQIGNWEDADEAPARKSSKSSKSEED